ncbi:MAG: hypothetical protein CL573_07350 [Alphaproteobacteria bacterium]|nr:hypothetical protein [Alphaproteobacteria bacterium]HCP00996.1 hypothetical protein [Rhodospirillaceae bacterium]
MTHTHTTNPFKDNPDKFHEECGVFGVLGTEDAAAFTALGLHALQHRRQEAADIVFYDGKRVILVNDSVVRGTTSQKIIEMVRNAGAAEVHVRIASPPTKSPCFYGIDTPLASELPAAKNDVDGIQKLIGADSLADASMDGLYRAMGGQTRDADMPQYCDACFSGEYPITLTNNTSQMSLLAELA